MVFDMEDGGIEEEKDGGIEEEEEGIIEEDCSTFKIC
jgi:hypothetical protein